MAQAHTGLTEIRRPIPADERARLLNEQLPQVRYIARRIHNRLPAHVPMDDLVQVGIIGLMDALDKFDPGKHVQLQSYAKFRVRGAILDSLRDLDWSPRDLRRNARRLEQVERDCRAQLGRAPGEAELAAGMGMELTEFQHFLGELRGVDLGSLQDGAKDAGETGWAETDVPDPQPDPFQLCSRSETKQKLMSAIDGLLEREREVLALYYHEELTMREIGAVLGIGESRVSQVHSAALIRLRVRLGELPAEVTKNAAPFAGSPAGRWSSAPPRVGIKTGKAAPRRQSRARRVLPAQAMNATPARSRILRGQSCR